MYCMDLWSLLKYISREVEIRNKRVCNAKKSKTNEKFIICILLTAMEIFHENSYTQVNSVVLEHSKQVVCSTKSGLTSEAIASLHRLLLAEKKFFFVKKQKFCKRQHRFNRF